MKKFFLHFSASDKGPFTTAKADKAGSQVFSLLAGFTASNFANSHCSDVVGALPLGSKGPVQK